MAGAPLPGDGFTVFPFGGRVENGVPFNLAVWEISWQRAATPRDLCGFVAQNYGSDTTDIPLDRAVSKPLGSMEGIEFQQPDGSLVVRAVALDRGIGYAISMSVDGSAIDEAMYQMFELVCQSVQQVSS